MCRYSRWSKLYCITPLLLTHYNIMLTSPTVHTPNISLWVSWLFLEPAKRRGMDESLNSMVLHILKCNKTWISILYDTLLMPFFIYFLHMLLWCVYNIYLKDKNIPELQKKLSHSISMYHACICSDNKSCSYIYKINSHSTAHIQEQYDRGNYEPLTNNNSKSLSIEPRYPL